MPVEDRMREIRRRAAQALGNQRVDAALEGADLGQRLPVFREQAPECRDVVARGGLVERDAEHRVAPFGKAPQVHADRDGARRDLARGRAGIHGDGVERAFAEHGPAHRAQAFGQHCRVRRHALGDALQAGRAVIDRVHARDHGGQHLRRADIGGGAFAPDVLLARLQRESVGGAAVRVDAHSRQAAGQAALVFVSAGEVAGVRAAAAHRHAEALRRAAGDVGTELARRHHEREREQVGRDDERGVVRMDARRIGAHVVQLAMGGGPLREHGEVVTVLDQRVPCFGRIRQHDLEAERPGARLQHLDRLRVGVARDDDLVALALHAAFGQRHGLRGGGRFVEHRRVGDRHAGEVAHHRLEVHQRLEPALRDLSLVRRVSRVPGRVLEHVAQDDAGRVGTVVALADEALQHLVLGRDAL